MTRDWNTPRLRDALAFCLEIHGKDTRKGNGTPYVAHLLSVCALVLEDGGSEEEAIAALLHDTLEDHPRETSRGELEARFGTEVRALVEACTDTPEDYAGGPKPPWRRRKEAYIAHLATAPPGALRIAVADKLHNARDLLVRYRQNGDEVWSGFNAPKPDQLWFHAALVRAFREAGCQGPMIDELASIVSEISGHATG